MGTGPPGEVGTRAGACLPKDRPWPLWKRSAPARSISGCWAGERVNLLSESQLGFLGFSVGLCPAHGDTQRAVTLILGLVSGSFVSSPSKPGPGEFAQANELYCRK